MNRSEPSAHIDLQHLRKACSECSLADLCLPMGLDQVDIESLSSLVKPSPPLHTGEHVFRTGDMFQAIYAVHSGCFKTYLTDDAGREQVLGFHLPGELMGLAAIYPDRHQANAMALNTASVCRLPYNELSALAMQIPGLQKQLLRLLSKDIVRTQAVSGDFTAEERLAAFLMSMSHRLYIRGYSATEYLLCMTRRDIANYLRLATETVSRVFAKFQGDKLIHVDRRGMKILDAKQLEYICRNVSQL